MPAGIDTPAGEKEKKPAVVDKVKPAEISLFRGHAAYRAMASRRTCDQHSRRHFSLLFFIDRAGSHSQISPRIKPPSASSSSFPIHEQRPVAFHNDDNEMAMTASGQCLPSSFTSLRGSTRRPDENRPAALKITGVNSPVTAKIMMLCAKAAGRYIVARYRQNYVKRHGNDD